MTLRLVTAMAIGAVLLSVAPAAAAGPATITGELTPGTAKLPKSASKGEAQVLALNIDSMAYGGAAPVGRNGRYKLRLPAGKWALRSSIVELGKPYASFTSAAIATRSGQRRTLPLTLKRFKKPRKKRKRATVANINPRDGRPYPGEAFGIEKFTVIGGGADLAVLGNGAPDMITTDMVITRPCEYTIVEWRKRAVVTEELALSQSEYVDPASRLEAGHVIDPEILIRGRIEDRPGTPHRLAMYAWLVDAKTGQRLSGDVSSVTLNSSWAGGVERLGRLIVRDLICARTTVAPPVPQPSPPPSPPVPTAATNVYTGTFSGEAYSEAAAARWTWTGTVRLDAAQDSLPFFPPPNGAPPGTYRTFSVSSGGVDLAVEFTPPGDCALKGSGHVDFVPGLLSQVVVQLDVPNPAYVVHLAGLASDTITATRSGGAGCTGTTPVPIFTELASTGETAHTSPSYALEGSQAVLTPQSPFDYDYTTRWSLAPS